MSNRHSFVQRLLAEDRGARCRHLPFFHSLFLFALLRGVSAIADPTSIPFTYEKHIPFVQVQSPHGNQPPLCFILDTGASPTVIHWASLGQLRQGSYHVSQPGKDFETATTCGMGNAPAGYVQGICAMCGGLPLRYNAVRTDIANISRRCGHKVDGLLGTDFLRNKILTIDFANHTLHVEQAPGTDNFFARLIHHIPFARREAVYVKITTPPSRRPLVFLVDTGASHCIIDAKIAQRMNLSLDTERDINVVGGQQFARGAHNFVGNFDGHPLPSQIVVLDLSKESKGLTHPIDGVLGMDFMENYTVKINFHTGQVQLLPI